MNGIMRVEKRKMQAAGGIHAENNREADKQKDFVASDIDWERTNNNIRLIDSQNLQADIKKVLHEHGIDKWRKDAVTFLDGLYTASSEFFEGKPQEEIVQYFEDCLDFHKQTYGDYVVNAVIHLDEATPHMHVQSVPLVAKNKFNEEMGVPEPTSYKLSAKEIMGNIKAYHERQDQFYEQVGKKYNLERGQIKDNEHNREHLTVLRYKEQETEKSLEQATELLKDTQQGIEQNKAVAVEIQQRIEHKQNQEQQLDKHITKRESRLNALEGQIKDADELKRTKADKGLFGRSKDEITLSWSEYADLDKTAKAVKSVQSEKTQLDHRERIIQEKEAEIESLHAKAKKKHKEAKAEYDKYKDYKDKEENYILGTAQNMANKQFEEYKQHLKEGYDSDRLESAEEYMEQFVLEDGRSLLEHFEEHEQERIAEIEECFDRG